jgi:hypothetical protein
MEIRTPIILTVLLVSLVSCDRPECNNTNPVFDSNEIESIAYKEELVKEIERVGEENLSYWIADYIVQNGREYITVNIQGGGLCAKGMLQVINWTNIEGIRRNKGDGYHGAQLAGLTFNIIDNGNSIDFIYEDVERIVD